MSLVGAAHRQQPQEREHAGEGEVGESQQHGRPSWRACWVISARVEETAGQVTWMELSAPTAPLIFIPQQAGEEQDRLVAYGQGGGVCDTHRDAEPL